MKTFSPRRSLPGRFAGGFTLVELTIVIVLLVLMSGAAATSMKGLAASQQNLAASRLRSMVIYAQQCAVGSGQTTYVVIEADSEKISVFTDDPSKPGKAHRIPLADPLTRGDMSLTLKSDGGIKSVDIGGANECQFNAQGSPLDSKGNSLKEDATIALQSGIVVTIVKNTGLVTVE